MRIAREFDFRDLEYNCWDCEDVLEAVANANMEDSLMDLLEEVFNSDVPTLTEVNDLLRFDGEWVLESLGIEEEDDEEDDDDEDGEPCPFTGKLCDTFECEECDIKRR